MLEVDFFLLDDEGDFLDELAFFFFGAGDGLFFTARLDAGDFFFFASVGDFFDDFFFDDDGLAL